MSGYTCTCQVAIKLKHYIIKQPCRSKSHFKVLIRVLIKLEVALLVCVTILVANACILIIFLGIMLV